MLLIWCLSKSLTSLFFLKLHLLILLGLLYSSPPPSWEGVIHFMIQEWLTGLIKLNSVQHKQQFFMYKMKELYCSLF